MENLRNTLDSAAWSREVEKSFYAYLRILESNSARVGPFVGVYEQEGRDSGNQVQILEDLLSQLRTVEEIRKVEFLKRESVLTARDQVGGSGNLSR